MKPSIYGVLGILFVILAIAISLGCDASVVGAGDPPKYMKKVGQIGEVLIYDVSGTAILVHRNGGFLQPMKPGRGGFQPIRTFEIMGAPPK